LDGGVETKNAGAHTCEVMEMDKQYVIQTYGRIPIVPVKGNGARVWDADGKEYLDFVAGLAVNSLGHCHPAVLEALCAQADKIMHCTNLYYIDTQAQLAKLLVENSPCDRAFFCNTGAEANEAAIKLARKYARTVARGNKYEIITATKSFHGRTLATLAATGQPKFHKGFEPLPAGFKYVPFNDLSALEEAVGAQTCAVMLEPVQGEGGVYPADCDYLQGVREICDRHGLLLIFDEVQCGLGRTGKFFAHQHYGVTPDIMTLAKALGNGFPIGAMLAREEVAATFKQGDHGTTFGGNPLACAVGLAVVKTLLTGGIVENAGRVGEYFKKRLIALQESYDVVREVRGLGLMLGLELKDGGVRVMDLCRENGLLVNCVAGKTLRFLPPLIITEGDVDRAVEILEGALASSI